MNPEITRALAQAHVDELRADAAARRRARDSHPRRRLRLRRALRLASALRLRTAGAAAPVRSAAPTGQQLATDPGGDGSPSAGTPAAAAGSRLETSDFGPVADTRPCLTCR
jgi:hypothetical protein